MPFLMIKGSRSFSVSSQTNNATVVRARNALHGCTRDRVNRNVFQVVLTTLIPIKFLYGPLPPPILVYALFILLIFYQRSYVESSTGLQRYFIRPKNHTVTPGPPVSTQSCSKRAARRCISHLQPKDLSCRNSCWSRWNEMLKYSRNVFIWHQFKVRSLR